MPDEKIDTANRFLVGAAGPFFTIMLTPPPALSRADALNLAAWLVALADDGSFEKLLEAVRNT